MGLYRLQAQEDEDCLVKAVFRFKSGCGVKHGFRAIVYKEISNTMKKQGKKTISVVACSLVAVVIFGTGVAYAATTLLNWNGSGALTSAGIFIEQSTQKIIDVTNQNKSLTKEKAALEKEIESLRKELEDASKEEGWTEKDQQIVDLRNEIISKENEVAHLTRQIEAANQAASDVQSKLDHAYEQLESAGISIWN